MKYLLPLLLLLSPLRAQDVGPFPPAAPESVGLTTAAVNAVRDEVAAYAKNGTIVGGELLIVKNRKTVLHEAFGDRDREDKKPMEKNTIFNIRSQTKSLTGAAMQILIDEGKVSLTDPAAKYLPGFDNDKSRMITVEQLLTHRSGLPLTVITISISQFPNLQAQADAAGKLGPQSKPGEKFWYSDAGTDAVAAIVEKVSGMTIDQFITQRLLQPLGMHDSFYPTKADDPRKARIASLYIGQPNKWGRFWKPGGAPMYPFAWGSQTLYSTPIDYARYLAFWLDGGKANGKQILSPAAMKRILTPVSSMSTLGADAPMPTGFMGLKAYYGQLSVLHAAGDSSATAKVKVIGHSGSDGTVGWAFPEHDLIICYFTQSRGQATVIRLESTISRELLRTGADNAPIPAAWKPYVGTYYANFAHYKNTPFKVLYQNGSLAVDIPDQLVFELKPLDQEGRFAFALTDKITVAFQKDAAGKVTGMKLTQAGQSSELTTEPAKVVPLKKEAVEKYLGKYVREEDKIIAEIVYRDGKLFATIPSTGAEVELSQTPDKKAWTSPNIPGGSLTFQEATQGPAPSFTITLPDGRKLVRKRVN
jgi:CubicO group peptidase (beta-lactamase class C family)